MSIINYALQGDIGVITVDNPPVNALSHTVRKGIQAAVEQAQEDTSRAILIICQGRTFIAGADISEFGLPPQAPTLPDMLNTIEQSNKPVIAALHGTALGGGFETALACHYRCAVSSARVGLPEVKLGLLPGAGGTQRVPRLTGPEPALELITSGNPVSAEKALSLNLIDRIIQGDNLLSGALEYAQELLAENAPLRRIRDIRIEPSSFDASIFETCRSKLHKRARGQIAPQNIVQCIEAAVSLPMEEGLAKERELFLQCLQSPQSAAMRHLFFAEREAAKIKGLSKETPTREIQSVGIIGGGTMGGGIAMCFANAGIPVKMLELNEQAIQRGMEIIDKNYSITVSKGKLSAETARQRQALITGTTDYNDLDQVDLVIEAVFEDLKVKQEVFAKLEQTCKPDAILATNTSYQDINLIAETLTRKENVVGLHFFSPANVMKLLEVVRCDYTADEVIATAMKLAKKINKVPVLSRVCYGFIGNRMLQPYAKEAQRCLLEGASPQQIDSAMQTWGMAMGPMAVGDLAGIDIGYKARAALPADKKDEPIAFCVADTLVEMGRLGQKTGAGYYLYDPQTRSRTPDPDVIDIIEQQAQKFGVERRHIDDDEIANRLILALINEGAKILEEGIAQRPGDVDIVYAFGYGFPVFQGGPMHYADTLGIENVYQQINSNYQKTGSPHWKPAGLLQTLSQDGRTLAQWAAD